MTRSAYLPVVLLYLVLLFSASAKAQSKRPISKHERDVIRFFAHHPRLAHTQTGERALWQILGHVVRVLDRQVQSATVSWPPHHLLWSCIARYESGGDPHNRDTGGNGHYGYLQMHPGWGYGTSYYASDDSQMTQEWAAERGYQANGYSRSWLAGQWGQTIGPCWQYA